MWQGMGRVHVISDAAARMVNQIVRGSFNSKHCWRIVDWKSFPARGDYFQCCRLRTLHKGVRPSRQLLMIQSKGGILLAALNVHTETIELDHLHGILRDSYTLLRLHSWTLSHANNIESAREIHLCNPCPKIYFILDDIQIHKILPRNLIRC